RQVRLVWLVRGIGHAGLRHARGAAVAAPDRDHRAHLCRHGVHGGGEYIRSGAGGVAAKVRFCSLGDSRHVPHRECASSCGRAVPGSLGRVQRWSHVGEDASAGGVGGHGARDAPAGRHLHQQHLAQTWISCLLVKNEGECFF
ncbi:unnamed protein product, partial [Ectocarpus sp. 4 AP-2014]